LLAYARKSGQTGNCSPFVVITGMTVRLLRASPWLAAALLAGCSGQNDQRWYGYYYEDVRLNGAPGLSVPFADAHACLAGMHAYMTRAPANAGFACARGCAVARDGGYVVDCQDMAR
jgi:hypothetical protein